MLGRIGKAAPLRGTRQAQSTQYTRPLTSLATWERCFPGKQLPLPRELIRLTRKDTDGEFLVRQVRTGQLEGLGSLDLVLVDLAGVLVVSPALEFLDAVLVLLVILQGAS